MTLMGCALDDKSRAAPAWIATWRTPGGNTIHDRLRGLRTLGTSEADAWVFALDHYPERGNLA